VLALAGYCCRDSSSERLFSDVFVVNLGVLMEVSLLWMTPAFVGTVTRVLTIYSRVCILVKPDSAAYPSHKRRFFDVGSRLVTNLNVHCQDSIADR
jgi:hypothetical protein